MRRSASRDTGAVAARMTSSRMIGRTAELAELEAALTDAAAGRPSLVFVAGESGVGKTRILDEAARRAKSAGGAPPPARPGAARGGGGPPLGRLRRARGGRAALRAHRRRLTTPGTRWRPRARRAPRQRPRRADP